MSLFEKSKQLRSVSPSPMPGSIPPKFNPSSKPIPTFRRPVAVKKTAPEKPKTLFEQKKDWTRGEFIRKATQSPMSGKGQYERKKMLEKELPVGRFGTYISEREAKTRLKELRGKEYYAKGKERKELKKTRQYLEKGTGLKGKY